MEQHHYQQIVVQTDRYRITGAVRLPPDGYQSRLSDFLNAADRRFLALTDAELVPLDGSSPIERSSFLALSVDHIVLAMPAEEQAE